MILVMATNSKRIVVMLPIVTKTNTELNWFHQGFPVLSLVLWCLAVLYRSVCVRLVNAMTVFSKDVYIVI